MGAVNRAVLLGSDYLLRPMASDLLSIRALPSVGSSLNAWVGQWAVAKTMAPAGLTFVVPRGLSKVLGSVSQQFTIYRGEATQSFGSRSEKMPDEVARGFLDPLSAHSDGAVEVPKPGGGLDLTAGQEQEADRAHRQRWSPHAAPPLTGL